MAGLLGWWARLLGVAVVLLVGVVIYTSLPPLVELDDDLALLVEDYPTARIVRDTWGIPHVYGKTDAEVAFGLAYAHAQDDFAAIQRALLAAQGRLATVEGKAAYVNDYLVHALRLRERVEAEYEQQLSPRLRAIVVGYADGLNYFAYLHANRLLVPKFFPISPQDVVAGFVHKLPSFTGLDTVVKGLISASARPAKAQRLMSFETRASNMSDTLALRWRQLQQRLVSLFLDDVLPAEETSVPDGVVADGPEEPKQPVQQSPIAVVEPAAHDSSGNADVGGFAFGAAPEHPSVPSSQGVVIDGVVYAQSTLAPEPSAAYGEDEEDAAAVPKGQPTEAMDAKTTPSPDEETTKQREFGSNAFAVSGRKTQDGSTFLVINPHQPWAGPFSLYEAHLHSEEGWDFVGGVFPGSPIPFVGHNRHLGWAHTVNKPDLVDVYELTMDKHDRLRYLFDGEWHTLERRVVPIAILVFGSWNWEVQREVLWSPSHDAPVIQNPMGTYAVRYSGSERIDQLEQYLEMSQATTFDAWSAAMSRQAMPLLNAVYADKHGNVFYGYNALLPSDRSAAAYDWSRPVPGNTSDTVWAHHYVPWTELPRTFNPSTGFVVNCNSSPFRATAGQALAAGDNPTPAEHAATAPFIERRMTNRALRALELLAAALSPEGDVSVDINVGDGDSAKKLAMSLDDVLRVKFDETHAQGSFMAYLVNRSLEAYDRLASVDGGKDRLKRERPLLVRAIGLLRAWDLTMSAHAIAAPLAHFSFRAYIEGPMSDRFYERCSDLHHQQLSDVAGDGWPSLNELGLDEERLLHDLELTARDLKRATGRIDPEWGRQLRLVRGRAEWDLSGGPDVLRTVHGTVDLKKGRVLADAGDGFLQVVRWDAQGQVHAQAVHPFGNNNYAKSLHFKDQAPVFADRRLREVWMWSDRSGDVAKAEAGGFVEEVYRPGREYELGKRALGLLGELGVQKRKEALASAAASVRASGHRTQQEEGSDKQQQQHQQQGRRPGRRSL